MSTDACLEASLRGHPFFRGPLISDPRFVVPGDVFVDGLRERFKAIVFRLMPIEHLVLHRPEERLHDAVVEAVPLPRHRLEDPAFPQGPDPPILLVLPALVGMEYEAAQVVTEGERPVEHPLGLGHVRAEAQVVGDDPSVVHVLDGAQVAFPPKGS